jgi:hypothetical protein
VLDVTVSGKSGSGEYVFGGAGRPDAAGRVTIGPLVPGRYTLSLAVSKQTGPGSSSSRGIAEKEIEVTAGPQAVEFEVPPLHDLAVEMGSARAGAAVQLSRVWFKGDSADPANRRTQTLDTEYADETGRVLFQRLQAGPYEVWSPELPRQRITVPETTVVRY